MGSGITRGLPTDPGQGPRARRQMQKLSGGKKPWTNDVHISFKGGFALGKPCSVYMAARSISITADQNNYALSAGPVLRITTDASRTVTGFVAETDATSGGTSGGRAWRGINVGSNDLVLANQSASSTAANRIITGTGADVTVQPDELFECWYDFDTLRWRILWRVV